MYIHLKLIIIFNIYIIKIHLFKLRSLNTDGISKSLSTNNISIVFHTAAKVVKYGLDESHKLSLLIDILNTYMYLINNLSSKVGRCLVVRHNFNSYNFIIKISITVRLHVFKYG